MRVAREGGNARLPLPEKKPRLPLRTRRRRMRVIAFVGSAIALVLLIYGVHALSYVQRLEIVNVQVSGAQEMNPNTIRQYVLFQLYADKSHFLSRASVFFYPKAAVEKSLVRNYPYLKSASIAHGLLSQGISVSVVERQPFALWCPDYSNGSSGCYVLDDTGYLFADESLAPPGGYLFRGPISGNPIGQSYAPSHFPGLLALLQALSQAHYAPLGATIGNDQDFTVPLASGFYIKASFGEDPATLVSNLNLTLSSSALQGQAAQLEYVDLRFGDKVYYKLQGTDATSTAAQ